MAVIAVAPTDRTATGSTVAWLSRIEPITFVSGKPDTAATCRPCLPSGTRLIPGNGSPLSGPRRFSLADFLQPRWRPHGTPGAGARCHSHATPGCSTTAATSRPQAVAGLTFPSAGGGKGGFHGVCQSTRRPQGAFEAGRLLFLRDWPYVYGPASTPGPEIANHNHLRLAISSAVRQALATGQPAAATIAALSGELKPVLQSGDNPHGPPPKITNMGGNTT